jgi:uncharacterized membrane protein required for colicin V production
VSWIDLVIVAVVLVATERGLSVGILRQVGSLVGFVTGFVVGILLAPSLARTVSGSARAFIAIFVVIAVATIGAVLGRQLGAAANLSLRRLKLGSVDRAGGAAFSAVGALIGCWLVAGLLVNVSYFSLSSAIEHSRLLTVMDRVMPPVPSVEAKVQALLRSANFPSVFAQIIAPSVPNVPVVRGPQTTTALGAAAASVLKITAENGCNVNREGTGFVIAPGLIITAAHVIAGAHVIHVGGIAARLLVLDVKNDVAVLSVLKRPRALSFASQAPPAKTPAAVAGYPLNGPLTITPAAIAGPLRAQGRDIYNNALFVRDLLVVNAKVQFGNSGSPVLVRGTVVGMVFSRSTSQSNVAYAVPRYILQRDLTRANVKKTVSSGACPAE